MSAQIDGSIGNKWPTGVRHLMDNALPKCYPAQSAHIPRKPSSTLTF